MIQMLGPRSYAFDPSLSTRGKLKETVISDLYRSGLGLGERL